MDVERSSVEAIRRIMRASDVHSRALLREYELTGPQLAVLKALACTGEAPIGALARDTFLGAPTVTGVVDRLQRQGWVTRETSTTDRRQVLIKITPSGRKMMQRRPPLLLEAFCDKLLQLSKARQQEICENLQQVAYLMEQSVLDNNSSHT